MIFLIITHHTLYLIYKQLIIKYIEMLKLAYAKFDEEY